MYKTLFLLLFVTFSASAKKNYLEQYCDDLSGKVVTGYKCPKSKLYIPWKFCTYKNDDGQKQFFDGCTGPTGGHTKLFYPHCIKHDLCYHHEPISGNKRQKDCDIELKNGLIESCKEAKNGKKCRGWAKTMYTAVRIFGGLAFNCANHTGYY